MDVNRKVFVVGGVLAALGLVAFLSPWASTSPDGLNKVAADHGFDDEAKRHALAESPMAGYKVEGVGNERVSRAGSGIIGVLVTFAAGFLLFKVFGARRTRAPNAAPRA